MKKLSKLWVFGPRSQVIHRKREYTRPGGRTLCGRHVGPTWLPALEPSSMHKCKRCAA